MNPTIILAELWADGVSITLAPDNANLVAPANRLTPAQREFIKAHKPALIDFLVEARATTKAVIAAAMRRCDEFSDNEQARAEMVQQVSEIPLHQHQDLLDHFNGKPVNFD